MNAQNGLPGAVQSSWYGFLEAFKPLRPDLYRYCRHLTRSPWEAEDLSQDTLARGFVTLAQLGESPPNPRAWLFRVASPASSFPTWKRSTHGPSLVPRDRDRALDCQLRDRFFDLDVNVPMQKIVTDKLRPEGNHNSFGVERAREQLEKAYAVADDWLHAGPWAAGETFSVADCAAAPALFYANQVQPFTATRPHLAAYFSRLLARPSFVRVQEEAKPYWALFPG